MKEKFDFICLLSKLSKSLAREGIKITSQAAGFDGMAMHIDFEGKPYGLFITETNILHDAIKDTMPKSDDSVN